MSKVVGIEVDAKHFSKKLPKYARTFFISEDEEKDVFMSPQIMGGDPKVILLCSTLDGAPIVQERKKTYVSSNWALKELIEIDHARVRDFVDRVRKCVS